MRKILYIDSSYTLSQIRSRGLSHILGIRLLGGYFDKAWSVHPVDTHPEADKSVPAYGSPIFEQVADNHTFIRGRYGRFSWLSNIGPLNALLALISLTTALVKLARQEKIQVVRAGDPLLCGLIGVIVARMSAAKLVVRINGEHDVIRAGSGHPIMPNLFRRVWIEEKVEQFVLTNANLVIAPSPSYASFAERKGALHDRIHLVRYGNLIDTVHTVAPDRRQLPEDAKLVRQLKERPWLLHVGRLHPVKHAEDCYDVLKCLVSQGRDVGLCLVGDGPLRETIEARAASDGLEDRILFLGNIDQTLLARILPLCAVVLSPLTGRALAEAAFAAAPIVAYDLDWQGELIQTNVTGILVPAYDVSAMADGVSRLLGNRVQAQVLGDAVRARAFSLLSPDEQTAHEIAAYQTLEPEQ